MSLIGQGGNATWPMMDFRPPPTNFPSSAATARAAVASSKQPTYTTAGTIYNPNSSQPLQPPTRRGRSFKWAQNNPTDLIPKSILNALPLKTSGCQTHMFHQYSPLQQNYDRAVSPFIEPDSPPARMPYERPRLPLSHHYGGVHKRPEEDEENAVDENKKEESDSDSEFGMDPLMGMTVKSLHNLASYPNPNQKRAQKALLRGIKQSTTSVSDRTHHTEASFTIRPIGSPVKRKTSDRDLPGGVQLNGRIQPSTVIDTDENSITTPEDETRSDSLGPSNITPQEGFRKPAPAFSTGAMGTGAPRPLTAGPPGQRQYRPSTFESTWKALQPKSPLRKPEPNNSDLFETAIGERGLVENDGPASLSDGFTYLGNAATLPTSPYGQTGIESKNTNPRTSEKMSLSTSGGDSVKDQAERGCHHSEDSAEPNIFAVPSWRDNNPEIRMKFVPGTDRLTDEALRLRNEENDRCWYEGSDFLGKTTSEAVIDLKVKKLECNLGAIGDGRPYKSRNHYTPIDIQEAIRIPQEEHSKPIMNMAFATILRCLEEDWCREILETNETPWK